MTITEQLLTGGVVVAIIGLLGKLLDWYLKRKDKEDSKKDIPIIDTIGKISNIYQIMDDTIRNTKFNRFLVLKSENGGGIPKLGNHLYASVILERTDSPLESVIERYQRLKVDGEYSKMLVDIYSKGKIEHITSDLPEGTLLRRIYDSEGVLKSLVFHLHTTKTAMFYCSIATTEKDCSDSDELLAETAADRISEIFKQTVT